MKNFFRLLRADAGSWFLFLACLIGLVLTAGCRTVPYAPPPQKATVEKVEVTVSDFYGRPDVFATISGRLSSNAAQLVDVEQSRGPDQNLVLLVKEQTPRGGVSTNRIPNPPFQTRVPLEVLGLTPGQIYTVSANGVQTQFEMPGGTDVAQAN